MEAAEEAENDLKERGAVSGGGADVKGIVRPLADSISAEAAERASKQVREGIAQQQLQLDELQRFSVENKSLSELVRELPDSVSHHIMVPFGKAAFFPGRLKHTNEFLVLLGENHYAERSAKQTVEILDRRSQFLDQKIAGTKAQIADLEAESAFVSNTAEEAKAGLVEIREEYLGSGQLQLNQASNSTITAAGPSREAGSVSQVGSGSQFGASTSSSGSVNADEDREHDLLMARLSELELAEAAAGEDNEDSEEEGGDDSNAGVFDPFGSDFRRREVSKTGKVLVEEDYDSEETEDDDSQMSVSDDDEDEDEGVADAERNYEKEINSKDEDEDDQTLRHEDKGKQEAPMGRPLSRFAREAYSKKGALDSQHALQKKVTFQLPTDKNPESDASQEIYSRALEKSEAVQGYNDLPKELQEWRREGAHQRERHADEVKDVGSSSSDRSRVPSMGGVSTGQRKAFTGIVTERSSAEPAVPTEEQPEVEEGAQQSRPMSKFKMRQAQAGRR
ncbi:unnamed protein product [Calypogeia fissa]